jgi:acetyltransferase-like isoleucine patch superfamily enzyme
MNCLSRLFARWNFVLRSKLQGRESRLFISSDSALRISRSADILISGQLSLGRPLQVSSPFASRPGLNLFMGAGSRLSVKGDVSIANGCTLMIGRDAEVILNGPLTIAHDCIIICNIGMEVGSDSAISWGCTLIDSDLHDPVSSSGRVLKRPRRRIVIGERVGIQSGVTIPSGLSIGSDSVVSAGTILRHSIDSNCFVYSEQKLKIRKGIKSGLPWS